MNVKGRDYSSKGFLYGKPIDYTNFNSFSRELVYPEYVLFFSNVRYLALQKYKTFKEFEGCIYAGIRVKLTLHTVYGYEKGFFRTCQYNWLVSIAHFLGVNVHEMLTIDFRARAGGGGLSLQDNREKNHLKPH